MDVDTIHTQSVVIDDKEKEGRTEDGPDTDSAVPWRTRTVTVEPVLFLYLLGGGLMWPAFSALVYEKVCTMQFEDIICKNLENHSVEEDIVQGQASHWFLWSNYVFEAPAIILALCYGSLSDHVSRRLAIAIPVIGQALSGTVYAVSAAYMDSHIGYTLLGGTLSGLSGGWISLFMACFSYLGETTSVKDRTKRVLIAEGIAGTSMALSFSVSGIILDNSSYLVVFSVTVGIYLLCILYTVVLINEPPKKQVFVEKGMDKCSLILYRMKDAVTTIFRKREDNGRLRIVVSIMIIFTTMVSGNAIHTVGYLFLKRRPLSWTQSTYGIFVSLNMFIPSLCLLFLVPWMKVKFKLQDTTLLIIGIVSGCLSEFWFSFCKYSWMVFLMPFLGSFRSCSISVLRSILSKLVHSHELGKMFAVLGAMQSLSGVVGTTLFNTIYPHTLSFWPGFCFTLGTILAFIPASMVWWLHRDLGKSPRFRKLSETEIDNDSSGLQQSLPKETTLA